MTTSRITRRSALKVAAAGLTVPFVYRLHSATAAPSETLLHAAIGAGGMGASDIGSLTKSKHLKLVAIADVDAKSIAAMKQKFPDTAGVGCTLWMNGSEFRTTNFCRVCSPKT